MTTALKARNPLEADPELRFAAAALEPETVAPHFNARFGPCSVERAELVRHRAGRRALVAYTLRRPEGVLELLGKVRARGTDRKTHDLQSFLWRHGFGETGADAIGVAEPLGVVAAYRMTLQRRVPGSDLEPLLRPGAERLVQRTAQALYKLHRSRPPLTRRHTPADELAILERQFGGLLTARPHLEKRLTRVLSACQTRLDLPSETPTVTLHRDFYPEQVRVQGGRLYLLDLDLCAGGDPAVDVGNFAAHLREYALRTLGDADALRELERAFTGHYGELSGVPEKTVETYTTLSLARLVAVSERLPARRPLTEALLELTETRLGV